MVKRTKVALIYKYREDWIGGTYYIHNLIRALNFAEDERKPFLHVVSEKDDYKNLLKEIQYPYISWAPFNVSYNIIQRVFNRFTGKLLNRRIFDREKTMADVSFPVLSERQYAYGRHKLFWLADFQDHHLPLFFTQEEIEFRKNYRAFVVKKGKNVVFSSESAKKDFSDLFPNNRLNTYVLPFAVVHPNQLQGKKNEIREKYRLPDEYFICSNQFWKHKNHRIIYQAISYLKNNGTEVHIVLTGKESDYRDPSYFDSLKKMAEDLGINANISMLGFISRIDQLSLMKNAIAVIQPSLFEGWSTVVEDAKALGARIITSGIPVHHEQLRNYPLNEFFSPDSEYELAKCMLNSMNTKDDSAVIAYDYKRDIYQFASKFIGILEEVVNN
jgi:glycosyltransferase involved in cell wall biosynthesis